jgi:hypothetical protein
MKTETLYSLVVIRRAGAWGISSASFETVADAPSSG